MKSLLIWRLKIDKISIEEIRDEYLNSVLDIYNYYVLNTTATFRDHALSVDEMRTLVFFDNPKYRTFIIVCETNICGYFILKRHKERDAKLEAIY